MPDPRQPGRLGRSVPTSVGGEAVQAFIPPPLPPDPPFDLGRLIGPLQRAQMALGRLDGVASMLPDTELFLYMYVRKEALLSSQIEGTQSSLSDLLLYLKARRAEYYELLQRVREQGDWEAWLAFFLDGVAETAEAAAEAARQILALFDEDRTRIEALGRPAGSALRVHDLLKTKPLLSVAAAGERLHLSSPTIAAAISHLVGLGILRETTGRQRGRLFAYDRYLAILSRGTEPLPR